jgi:hypothetical protein
MTTRPPSEISAAPTSAADIAASITPEPSIRDRIQRAIQAERDRLTRELSSARLALIALEVDKAAAEKMAIETGRELAEARKALEKAEGGLVTLDVAFTASEGARVAVATERDQAMRERDLLRTCGIIEVALRNPNVASYCEHWEGRTEKAEASCREHAEAIVALRDALDGVMAVVAANNTKLGWNSISTPDEIVQACALLALPEGALASRLSAEREAERAVVRAARRWVDSLQAAGKRYGVHYTGSPEYQYVADALAALPSSKGAIREAERLALERARQIAQNVIDAGRRCGSETGSAELVRNEIIRALSQPETPAASAEASS